MKYFKRSLYVFLILVLLLFNSFSYASTSSTNEFFETASILNSGKSNFWIAQDSEGNYYCPGMSGGTVEHYDKYLWKYTNIDGHLGLYFQGSDVWVLHRCDVKTGQFTTVDMNSIGRRDFFDLSLNGRNLKIIYSNKNIVYNFSDDTHAVGDVFFTANNKSDVDITPGNNTGGDSDDSNLSWFERIIKGISNIFNGIGNLLDYLNPFSDKFLLKDFITTLGSWFQNVFNFLGSILEYLNPFSDKFLLKTLFTFLGDCLKYINPFDVDNFLGYKLVGLILDGLRSLFVPSDDYFSNQFGEVKETLQNKLAYQSYIDLFGTLEDFSGNGATVVDFEGYKVGDSTISQDNFLNFNLVTKYKDTWFSWVRAIFFIGLVIYNINQVYKMIRGTNLADGLNTLKNASSGGKEK